jgi:hypothetical protein
MGSGGPTLAEILTGTAPIVRGVTGAQQEQQRVMLPRPRAVDIETITKLYESGASGTAVWTAAQRALPFELPSAKVDCIIETGTALVSTAPSRILQSFVSDHDNDVVSELIKNHEIGQLSKLPRGNLCLKVKSVETRRKLEGQEVVILGHRYKIREHDPLEDRFYVDIAGVSSDQDVQGLFTRLYEIGAKPLYATNREVHLTSGITTATLRVYFVESVVPSVLVIGGAIVNQLVYRQRLHYVNGKGAAPPATRTRFGQRSEHCLDLDVKEDPKPTSVKGTPGQAKKQAKPASGESKSTSGGKSKTASVGTSDGGNKSGESKKSVPGSTSDQVTKSVKSTKSAPNRDSNSGEESKSDPSPNSGTLKVVDLDECKSDDDGANKSGAVQDDPMRLSLSDASDLGVSPPGSPPAGPIVTLPIAGYELSKSRSKKRRFFDGDQVPVAATPKHDWTSENFYEVLADVRGSYDTFVYSRDDSDDEMSGTSAFQIVPLLPRVPESVRSNKNRTKRMTKFITPEGSKITVDDDWVAMDEFCALLQQDVDQAAKQTREVVDHQLTHLPAVRTLVTTETNVDKVVEELVRQPWAYTQALLELARNQDSGLESLASLHAFNRLLVTLTPDMVQAYTSRQCINSNGQAPSRESVHSVLHQWFAANDKAPCDLQQLLQEYRALAFFELVLLAGAPHFVRNDMWVQFICRSHVEWVPHRHTRLLKTSVLLRLLRWPVSKAILERFTSVSWTSDILTTLGRLCQANTSMCESGFEPVLQKDGDGKVRLGVLTAKRC